MLLNRLPLTMLPPRAVLLASDIILLLLPATPAPTHAFFAGREPPYGTVAVQSGSGPHQIAAMRLSDYHAIHDTPPFSFASDLTQDPELVDAFNTVVLSSDIAELASDLDLVSQRRVLTFLLGFCGKAFALADDPDFAASCLRLAQLCAPVHGAAEPVATVTAAWVVLSGVQASQNASIYILSQERVRRSNAPSLDGFTSLCLIERVGPSDIVLLMGEQPMQYSVGPVRAHLPDLVRSPARCGGAARRLFAGARPDLPARDRADPRGVASHPGRAASARRRFAPDRRRAGGGVTGW